MKLTYYFTGSVNKLMAVNKPVEKLFLLSVLYYSVLRNMKKLYVW